MSQLERAREIVRRWASLPKALRTLGEEEIGAYVDEEARLLYWDGCKRFLREEVSPDVLARSLHASVALGLTPVKDEAAVRLGASKYKGLPHLPPGVAWPRGKYFACQLNLAELQPLDPYGAFPQTGILYVFFDPGASVSVIHHDGPLDALRVAPCPDAATLPDARCYLDEFLRASALVAFEPRAMFYLAGDAYDFSRVTQLVPAELRREVEAALGFRVAERDVDLRLYGRPQYWQGEDEYHEDDGFDPPDPRHLLFQDAFGEGHVHVWISPEDAARRDFAKCWMDYSGT